MDDDDTDISDNVDVETKGVLHSPVTSTVTRHHLRGCLLDNISPLKMYETEKWRRGEKIDKPKLLLSKPGPSMIRSNAKTSNF